MVSPDERYKSGTVKSKRTVEAERSTALRYLEALGLQWVATKVPYVGETTKQKRLGDVKMFNCGCRVPDGPPLYREVESCPKHKRALGR